MDPRDSLEEDDFSGETLEREAVLSSEAFGRRLDQAVAELWPDLSRARLQRWLKSGELTVDGQRSKPGEKVLGGNGCSSGLSKRTAPTGGPSPSPWPWCTKIRP